MITVAQENNQLSKYFRESSELIGRLCSKGLKESLTWEIIIDQIRSSNRGTGGFWAEFADRAEEHLKLAEIGKNSATHPDVLPRC